jgi:CRISPR-associated protein Csd1
VRYYEILAAEENSAVPKLGYGTAKISFSLNIDDDGNLINLTSCKIQDGKKLVAKPMTVPEPVTGRTGTKPVPDFLYGNSSYVLGFDNKGKPELTKKRFKSFKDFNIPILKNAGCKEAEAVIKFLEKWDAEKAVTHPALTEYIDEIKKGAVLIFRYYGGKRCIMFPP